MEQTNNAAQKPNKHYGPYILFCLLAALFLLAAVKLAGAIRKDALAGNWTPDQTTVYSFDGHGRGSLNLPLNDYAFSYSISERTLTIDFDDESAADHAYTFSIEGSTLTMDSNTGSIIKLERTE